MLCEVVRRLLDFAWLMSLVVMVPTLPIFDDSTHSTDI